MSFYDYFVVSFRKPQTDELNTKINAKLIGWLCPCSQHLFNSVGHEGVTFTASSLPFPNPRNHAEEIENARAEIARGCYS